MGLASGNLTYETFWRQALRWVAVQAPTRLSGTVLLGAALGVILNVFTQQLLLCGYVFEDRRRLTRPSRCPACKRSSLQSPSFRIDMV